VPHRQVVLTIPKRLRAYCLYRRRLLGEIARVAACTLARYCARNPVALERLTYDRAATTVTWINPPKLLTSGDVAQ